MLEAAHFTSPPPTMGAPPMGGPPNMSLPPPNMAVPPPNMPGHPGHHFNRYNSGGPPAGIPQQGPRGHFFQQFRPYPRPTLDPEFDGKRLRKSVMRKTVDYNAAIIKMLEARVWQRDFRDRRALQPDVLYYPDLQPPRSYEDNPMNAVTTRFVKTATNKMRCPVFCMAWTPEGRRLVTGASSGEFTLWNGLTFNFETILQAHDSPVRTMVWSHNEQWMVTADHAGYVKYWQSNMNNVKMFQGHKEAVRGISFSPSDSKFATCSDDGTIRVWDFLRCHEERILRGHGADVKCVDWHPQKGLIVSGSKDNQQPVKLWDPKTGQSLATLHAHKSTVMDVKWNSNGNWLITASRDHLLKLFDIRQLGQELQTFRGHKKESSSVAWHPYHEGLFASGGSDGAILFWHVGADKEVGAIEQAHDSIVWTLAWHPLGHILCSGSNDHTSKFWTRNRPGDQMRDKYNLNNMPAGVGGFEEMEHDDSSVIPGMGPEDKVENTHDVSELSVSTSSMDGAIPGLDFDMDDKNCKQPLIKKGFPGMRWNPAANNSRRPKVPYSKPIPRNFQAQWNDTARPNIDEDVQPWNQSGRVLESKTLNGSHWQSHHCGSTVPTPFTIPDVSPPYPASVYYHIPEQQCFPVHSHYSSETFWRPKPPFSQDPLNMYCCYHNPEYPDPSKPIALEHFDSGSCSVKNGDDNMNGENREADQDAIAKMIQQIVEKVPGVVPVTELEPTALFMYGKVLPVTPDSVLARTINNGADAIYRLINCGAVEDLVNDISHDENTQYYHEDPSVDSELRSLKAYELPRRPPLLSTPNIPPQKLPDRGRGRGRGRDRERDPGRGRSRDMDDDDEDYRDGQSYDDHEDDYYNNYEEDDSDAIHQRFMSEEEEIYNAMHAQDANHSFGDQDLREQQIPGSFGDKDMRAAGNGDQDLRQPPSTPGPSLLGIAPGIPAGATGVLGRSQPTAPFIKDLDMRRSGPLMDRDPRQKHGAGAGAVTGPAVKEEANLSNEDRDYRRLSRPPLLPQGPHGLLGKFPPANAAQDPDYRQQVPGSGEHETGRGYRAQDEYDDGELGDDQEEDPSYGRGSSSRSGYSGSSRWGPSAAGGPGAGDGGDEDYDDSGSGLTAPRDPRDPRWGGRGGRGMTRGMRGAGGWESKRGHGPGPPGMGGVPGRGPGLLETPKGSPKGGLLATPNMPMQDEEYQEYQDYHGGKRRRWDEEGEPSHEDGEDGDGGHRGGYRGRGRGRGWGGGYSSNPRGSWAGPGPMRGHGRGHPRGGRRGRGRN